MAYSNITLTTQTGLSFITGEFIQLIHDSNNYMFGQIVSYNPSTGSLTFTPTRVIGSGTYSTWEVIASGAAGNDGTSGTSGINGTSGTSGATGTSGASGTSGTSGTDGTSGSSGINGTSGTSGLTGTSGTSGVNGTSGVSGTSGTSGVDGASGTSGVSGTSGTSGVNGTSGTAGTSGTSVSVSGTAGYVTYFNSSTTVTGSSNLFWDSTNNYLAIGNPATRLAQLHVYNASAAASFLLQTNSTTDYSEIAVRNNSSTATSYFRQYSTAATGSDFGITRAGLALFFSNYATNFAIGTRNGGDLIFGTADTERARILASNGYFGLGTSSPSYLLDVNGTGRFQGALNGTSATFSGSLIVGSTPILYGNVAIKSNSSTSYFGLNVIANANNNFIALNHTGSVGVIETEFSTGGAHTPLQFVTGGSTRLTIGTNGAATFSSSVTANAYINNYNDQGALRLYNTASAFAGGIGNGAWVEGTATTDIAIFSANNMKFYAGGSSTSKMTITSGGNVGIGISTPNALLHNNGSAIIGSGTISNGTTFGGGNQINRLKVETGNYTCLEINGSTSGGSIQFTYGSNLPNQVGGLIGYNYASGAANEMWVSNNLSGILGFATNNTERMRITSGGNVLIGTTSSNGEKLQVSGGAYITQYLGFGLSSIDKYIGQGNQISGAFQSYDLAIANYASSGRVPIITSTGAGVYLGNGATSWATWSDERLKNINSNIENALDKLSNIRAVNYSWKSDDTNKEYLGLIAQDIESVFPQVIDKSKSFKKGDDTEYLSVRYTELIPVLVKALQEQQQQIQELKAEIDELKNK